MCLALPLSADDPAQVAEPQQRSIDTLLNDIQAKRAVRSAELQEDPKEQLRRLRSQLIDVKVERDLLSEENEYLRLQLNDLRNSRSSSRVCPPGECISLAEAEEQQLLQHIVYSLSMYRLGEFMHSVIPVEDVEAHTRAQKIMEGARRELELLGFDTTDPEEFPTLEELLEQFEAVHEAHDLRLSTN